MSNCVDKKRDDYIVQPKFMGPLPDPCSISDIQPELIVFRRNQSEITIGSDMDEENAINLLISSDLLAKSRVIFITHGFMSDKHKGWMHQMKDKIINQMDLTVVIVGWGKGADIGLLKYDQASSNSLAVGKWLSFYLREIRKRCPDINIWGLGHSLGAHLMGVAGRESHVMDRITGLDPAGVGFQHKNLDKRLTKTDAKLVDVIHSDGKAVPYFGTLVPLGTIDFYPNFGWGQPTYDKPEQKPFMISSHSEPKGPLSPYGNGFTVSHERAIDYFIWSIDNQKKFRTSLVLEDSPGVEKAVHRLKNVDIETEMGYFADQYPNNVGKQTCYYVHTNASEPWL